MSGFSYMTKVDPFDSPLGPNLHLVEQTGHTLHAFDAGTGGVERWLVHSCKDCLHSRCQRNVNADYAASDGKFRLEENAEENLRRYENYIILPPSWHKHVHPSGLNIAFAHTPSRIVLPQSIHLHPGCGVSDFLHIISTQLDERSGRDRNKLGSTRRGRVEGNWRIFDPDFFPNDRPSSGRSPREASNVFRAVLSVGTYEKGNTTTSMAVRVDAKDLDVAAGKMGLIEADAWKHSAGLDQEVFWHRVAGRKMFWETIALYPFLGLPVKAEEELKTLVHLLSLESVRKTDHRISFTSKSPFGPASIRTILDALEAKPESATSEKLSGLPDIYEAQWAYTIASLHTRICKEVMKTDKSILERRKWLLNNVDKKVSISKAGSRLRSMIAASELDDDEDSELDEEPHVHKTFLRRLSSTVVFGVPFLYAKRLEELWEMRTGLRIRDVDETKEMFLQMKKEWTNLAVVSGLLTPIGTSLMGLTATQPNIPLAPRVAATFSVFFGMFSVIIAFFLVYQHHDAEENFTLGKMQYYLEPHRLSDFIPLAFVLSLPVSLLLWSLISFIIAVLLASFQFESVQEAKWGTLAITCFCTFLLILAVTVMWKPFDQRKKVKERKTGWWAWLVV